MALTCQTSVQGYLAHLLSIFFFFFYFEDKS